VREMNRLPRLPVFLELPLMAVMLPMLVASGFAAWVLPGELWLAWEYRRRGRYLSPGDLARRSRAGRGTILFDRAYPSGYGERVWWTGDEVLARAPVGPPTEAERFGSDRRVFAWHAFDRWVTGEYLEPEAGKALWVGMGGRCRGVAELQRRYPGCAVVETFSGGKMAEEMERAYARERGQDPAR
jgi:hypothetical protein